MLQIRASQLKVLRQPIRQHFEERMAAHLRAAFAEQLAALDDAGLRSLIRLGVEKADRHRITAAPHVARFIEHMALHGANFDEPSGLPGAAAILEDPSLDAAAKLGRLDEQSAARLGD